MERQKARELRDSKKDEKECLLKERLVKLRVAKDERKCYLYKRFGGIALLLVIYKVTCIYLDEYRDLAFVKRVKKGEVRFSHIWVYILPEKGAM